jgi:hypothetical protein
MIVVVSLLFIGVGLVLFVRSRTQTAESGQEFSRFGARPIRSRQFKLAVMGAVIGLGGVALLLLSWRGSS